MTVQSAPTTTIVPASDARVLRAFGNEIAILLDGSQTGGRYTVFSSIAEPGGGPPLHYHTHEDEWFYVIEGRAEFYSDGRWIEASPGSVVFTPRGVVHTFRNPGDTALKMLTHTAPSGFETFFARCAEEFAKPGAPSMQRLVEIAAEHGLFFVDR